MCNYKNNYTKDKNNYNNHQGNFSANRLNILINLMEMFIRQILLFLLFITKKRNNKNESTIRYTNRIAARIVIVTMKRRDLFINSLTA